MGTGLYSFPKERHLRKSSDFQLVRQGGKRRHTPNFIVVVLHRSNSLTRLGLTVSRKVGGAVQRNRVKRLVREFFRNHINRLPVGIDISIIAKKGAAEISYARICEELKFLVEK
ncbi:MAG: ribonuclease P protein component [Desulfuromonadales bacterium C00003068]|jgi:ribonuclease P protein component|nr:MAG: ribonuclease P protein component [Desulfuromonadales bacterium C00003068]